jgi:Protein of unknown function (DUF2726)
MSSAVAHLDPLLLLALLIGLALVTGSQLIGKPKRRKARRQYPTRQGYLRAVATGAPKRGESVVDAGSQLNSVMSAEFTIRPLLSAREARVFSQAERILVDLAQPWRVMAQVSLGEILASSDKAAFWAINAKRVDLLLVSEKYEPIAAIEFQGEGHYQGSAAARDAVKKEALRKAGIRYIEMTANHTPTDLRREIERLCPETNANAA